MSVSFSPNTSAVQKDPWDTAQRSQRDLSLQVPLNYVNHPAVSLTAACFPDGQYDEDRFVQCLSNLLEVGFRRLLADVYWDSGRQDWSFCPVSIPASVSSDTSPSATAPTPSSSMGALSTGLLTPHTTSVTSISTAPSSTRSSEHQGVVARSADPTSSSITSDISTSPLVGSDNSTSSSITQPSFSVSASPNGTIFEASGCACSSTINLSVLMGLLNDYFTSTENTLSANLLYLVFNMHASAVSPTKPAQAPSPSDLPAPSSLLGPVLSGNLSAYIYGPSELSSDRANLNSSWYRAASWQSPDTSYFTVNTSRNNIHSTPDGWPNEVYVEFSHGRRLLIGWGDIDPQMAGYNMSGDQGTIFAQDEFQALRTMNISDAGNVESGCIYQTNITDLAMVNSSWAFTTDDFNLEALKADLSPYSKLDLITRLTNCGISPLLNTTLFNMPADVNPTYYQNFTHSTIWSWAPGQPSNNETNSTVVVDHDCAVLDPSLHGRWRACDCSNRYLAACRSGPSPYAWELAPYTVPYSAADDACPPNTTFSAPRTALENTYLLAALYNHAGFSRPEYLDEDYSIWVDFNSLDRGDCWVMGGPNATCPYNNHESQTENRRTVIVPTIAAIIVLFVTALTLFVKCSANRRSSRRTKRELNGWDYEG
ncbi:MAG: hypothetical protein M1819_005330 [Sarea resinae]|nr:MAG: hypothetical protein M1819_005330 [Sarea resinae]